jgi:glycerophosphoinositol glycerophosphodiesterase
MLVEMLMTAVTNGFHIYFVIFLSFLASVVYLSYRLLRFPKPGPYVVKYFIRKNAANRNSPVIIAHRGGSVEAPENTLSAFRKAKENGATAVEFDLDFTQDGVPVIIHDSTVDRTTDGCGNVCELRYHEIQRLNASARHPLRFV